jgi:hypothetical protein
MAMIVPVSLLVKVQVAGGFDHGLEVRVVRIVNRHFAMALQESWIGWHALWTGSRDRQLRQQTTLQVGIDTRVVEIDCGKDNMKQGLCTLQLAFESLDILRRRIASAV